MWIIQSILEILHNLYFFIFAESISILIHAITIYMVLSTKASRLPLLNKTIKLLAIILFASLLEDLTWLVNILKISILPQVSIYITTTLVRVSWIFYALQYSMFSLFIEYLIPNQSKILIIINRFLFILASIYSSIFAWLILFKTYPLDRPEIEEYVFNNIPPVYGPVAIIIYLTFAMLFLSNQNINKKLRNLLYLFTLGILGPKILADNLQNYQPNFIYQYIINEYTVVAVCSLVISLSSYICIKHMLKLDFNNGDSLET